MRLLVVVFSAPSTYVHVHTLETLFISAILVLIYSSTAPSTIHRGRAFNSLRVYERNRNSRYIDGSLSSVTIRAVNDDGWVDGWMAGWVGVNRTKKSNHVFAIGAEGYRLLQLNIYFHIQHICTMEWIT